MKVAVLAIAVSITTLSVFPLQAMQESDRDFGITEKIGDTVPLDLKFKDELGKEVVLKDLITKPTILTLVYYKCPGICTPVLDGMARALDKVKAEPGVDFNALTISFDPREGPDLAIRKKGNYLKSMKRPFPSRSWRFLTGDKKSIEKITTAVGFEYKPEGKEYRHAATLMVLTPNGKISRYMYGVTYLPAHIQMAIQQAKREQTSPTVPKTVEYCFTEPPKGRIQALQLLSMGGALIAGMVTCLFVGLLIRRKVKPSEEQE